VEMEFKTDGSYASYDDMLYAMTGYFDYHTDMFHAHRSDFGTDWTGMLKDELDGGHPVPYRGQGDKGGHAYLCDGYQITDSQTYFHINWGWGGNYDGWFLLGALTPVEEYDFSELQGAVFGIRPSTESNIYFAYNDFERTAFKGWIYDGDGYYTASYTGNYGYGISSANRWLISPKIHIPDNDNAELAVWAKMSASNRVGKVLLSTTDTLRESFTVELGTIGPSNTNWNRYVYNLRSFKDRSVHIGFQYDSPTGYMILDDFRMSIPRPATDIKNMLPDDPALLEVYPNPFNPLVNIRYSHPGTLPAGAVRVRIYNMRGDNVSVLTPHAYGMGVYSFVWDAAARSSGIYICVLEISGQPALTQKMALIK
ncbi:MAG: C10 family peptidase, partial [FCB group bacterium]|nr:C10 family peptidase [FCB group bacterium]